MLETNPKERVNIVKILVLVHESYIQQSTTVGYICWFGTYTTTESKSSRPNSYDTVQYLKRLKIPHRSIAIRKVAYLLHL